MHQTRQCKARVVNTMNASSANMDKPITISMNASSANMDKPITISMIASIAKHV
jgi:hypothetical protein